MDKVQVKTSAETDVAKATITQDKETGLKELKMKGPLSEIFYKALNILFGKKNGLAGHYALENFQRAESVLTYSADIQALTSADVAEVASMDIGCESAHVIVINPSNEAITNPNFYSMQEVCKRRGIEFHNTFDHALESIFNNPTRKGIEQ